MKKITFYIMATCMFFMLEPAMAKATENNVATETLLTKPNDPEEIKALYERLAEINEMDKTELNLTEKKALRKEVRSIKYELQTKEGGLYISVGAIIIILLILIILL